MNKKSKLKEVGEAAVDAATLGNYGRIKKIVGEVRIKACEKKGGVWSKGECIPKSKIRKGKGKAVDWYPEKTAKLDYVGPRRKIRKKKPGPLPYATKK